MFIAAKFEGPPWLVRFGRRRENSLRGLKTFQFLAFDLFAGWIDPDFMPEITGHLHGAFCLNGLLVGIERFEFNAHLILGAIQIVRGLGIEVVTLASDTDIVVAGDFSSAGIGDAGLDSVFQILCPIAGSFKGERSLAGSIRFERLTLDDL